MRKGISIALMATSLFSVSCGKFPASYQNIGSSEDNFTNSRFKNQIIGKTTEYSLPVTNQESEMVTVNGVDFIFNGDKQPYFPKGVTYTFDEGGRCLTIEGNVPEACRLVVKNGTATIKGDVGSRAIVDVEVPMDTHTEKRNTGVHYREPIFGTLQEVVDTVTVYDKPKYPFDQEVLVTITGKMQAGSILDIPEKSKAVLQGDIEDNVRITGGDILIQSNKIGANVSITGDIITVEKASVDGSANIKAKEKLNMNGKIIPKFKSARP